MAHRPVEPDFSEPTGRPRSGLGATFRHCSCRWAQSGDPARALPVAVFPEFVDTLFSLFYGNFPILGKNFF